MSQLPVLTVDVYTLPFSVTGNPSSIIALVSPAVYLNFPFPVVPISIKCVKVVVKFYKALFDSLAVPLMFDWSMTV